jgi:arsenate reductase
MPNIKHKVLFICVHNSARSQMAEAFLNQYGGENFITESAGLEAGKLNPNVVKVMQEEGIDISHKTTQAVFDLFRQGKKYDVVVTVCDDASAERCPVFPGKSKRLAWSFPDPSSFTGTEEEILEKTRKVRDEIKESVNAFLQEAGKLSYWV